MIVNGGKIVQPVGVDAPEITARFSDPAGNVLGLYQQRWARELSLSSGRASTSAVKLPSEEKEYENQQQNDQTGQEAEPAIIGPAHPNGRRRGGARFEDDDICLARDAKFADWPPLMEAGSPIEIGGRNFARENFVDERPAPQIHRARPRRAPRGISFGNGVCLD